MLTIGICGASGSGKTTLAQELSAAIEGNVILLAQDAYYRDHPELPFHMREKLNYDEPSIFEHDLLLQDLQALREGRSVTEKAYDYAQHRRCDTGRLLYPADLLILEGIHVFYDPRIRDLLDL
ncbi:MAG: zeta toxin family protein, partial [Clostridia bacterium]